MISSPDKRLIAEAVVVVSSILFAFAIDAAWDQRQARESERAILRGLESELQADIRAIAASRDSTAQTYDRLTYFLGATRSELLEMSPPTAEREVFAPLSRQWGQAMPTGALDAATGSGDLAVISDPELRVALARLASVHAGVKEMTAVIDEMDARTVAILGEFEGVQKLFTMSEPGLDATTLASLRADPRIMGAATAKLWFTGGYLSQLDLLEATITETLELISGVLDD